jgi:hypothetical protein
MVSDTEHAFGFRAVQDFLSDEYDNYLHWGEDIDDSDSCRVLGMIAMVGTEFGSHDDEMFTISHNNRALFIDRDSVEDQKRFLHIYRERVEPLQKFHKKDNQVDNLYEPDDEEAILAKTGFELVQRNIITFGGFTVVESVVDGKNAHSAALFCWEPLAQNLAFDMRDELMKFEPALEAHVPKDEQEQGFSEVLKIIIQHGKTMHESLVDHLAIGYISRNLPTPNELRKQLGFAPPQKKKK